MAAKLPTDLPIKTFKTEAAFEKWLSTHRDAPGVWLKIAKKDSGIATVSVQQALDVVLCHGWIDGLKLACDQHYFLQRYTSRRRGSLWSRINVAKVEALIAAGRMREGGQAEIDAAKADGRWQVAYDSARNMPVPDELAAALAKNKKASAFFDKLDKTNRYAFCWRVQTAKKPETKAARAEKFVAMLAKGEKIHP